MTYLSLLVFPKPFHHELPHLLSDSGCITHIVLGSETQIWTWIRRENANAYRGRVLIMKDAGKKTIEHDENCGPWERLILVGNSYSFLFVFVFRPQCSGFTPGGLRGPYGVKWTKLRSAAMKVNTLAAVLSLWVPILAYGRLSVAIFWFKKKWCRKSVFWCEISQFLNVGMEMFRNTKPAKFNTSVHWFSPGVVGTAFSQDDVWSLFHLWNDLAWWQIVSSIRMFLAPCTISATVWAEWTRA